ncbi:hypothetical protein Bbelb_047700 [Branchiostoma belcheri]|nr:hypothetical protein Bbelb_047700 [Branchiostoma belcheri]
MARKYREVEYIRFSAKCTAGVGGTAQHVHVEVTRGEGRGMGGGGVRLDSQQKTSNRQGQTVVLTLPLDVVLWGPPGTTSGSNTPLTRVLNLAACSRSVGGVERARLSRAVKFMSFSRAGTGGDGSGHFDSTHRLPYKQNSHDAGVISVVRRQHHETVSSVCGGAHPECQGRR